MVGSKLEELAEVKLHMFLKLYLFVSVFVKHAGFIWPE